VPPDRSDVYIDVSRCDGIPQVSSEGNDMLIQNFSEGGSELGIFQMERNKAPDPKCFPPEFY
jgi:hypothetical protein